jgi:hypothetical protein
MPEYTFDVKLWAVARVVAADVVIARRKLREIVDCIDVGFDDDGVKLTTMMASSSPRLQPTRTNPSEASADPNESLVLIEKDGEAV